MFIGSAPWYSLAHFFIGHLILSLFFLTLSRFIRLPAAHHEEVCDLSKRFLIYPNSVGSYRSFVLFINSLEMFIFSLWCLTPMWSKHLKGPQKTNVQTRLSWTFISFHFAKSYLLSTIINALICLLLCKTAFLSCCRKTHL